MFRRLRRALGHRPLGRKNFQGNLFDRFEGLDRLFESAAGLRVLDLGMSEGHIAYEFARRGAALIHGLLFVLLGICSLVVLYVIG